MDARDKELTEQITTSMVFDKFILEGEGLSSDIWNKYLSPESKKELIKDEYLIRIGENINGVYFIKKGKIRSNLLGRDGAIKTLITTGEGCLFGEQLIFHKQPSLYEAIIIEDAEVYFFDKEDFLEIMKKDFTINLFVLQTISIKARMLAIQIEDISLRNISQTICRLLYTLCCYEEKNGNLYGDVHVFLSHQDLANMLGSHRVTITRNINTLKKQGILDYKYEKITIKDREKLREIAFE